MGSGPKPNRKATRETPGFTGPFKGNPQQGTLFDARTVRTGNEMGPRGYSRNRMADVKNAAQFSAITYNRRSELGDEGSTYTPFQPGGRLDDGVKGRPLLKLHETLARSTAPVEHLKGLMTVDLKSTKDMGGPAGYYIGRGKQHDPPEPGSRRGDIALQSQDEGWHRLGPLNPKFHENPADPRGPGPYHPNEEITFLHELGHHASFQTGTPHTEVWDAKERGQEETYADTYALKHWRADPRDMKRRPGYDPRFHTYGAFAEQRSKGSLPIIKGQENPYYRLAEADRQPVLESPKNVEDIHETSNTTSPIVGRSPATMHWNKEHDPEKGQVNFQPMLDAALYRDSNSREHVFGKDPDEREAMNRDWRLNAGIINQRQHDDALDAQRKRWNPRNR